MAVNWSIFFKRFFGQTANHTEHKSALELTMLEEVLRIHLFNKYNISSHINFHPLMIDILLIWTTITSNVIVNLKLHTNQAEPKSKIMKERVRQKLGTKIV